MKIQTRNRINYILLKFERLKIKPLLFFLLYVSVLEFYYYMLSIVPKFSSILTEVTPINNSDYRLRREMHVNGTVWMHTEDHDD